MTVQVGLQTFFSLGVGDLQVEVGVPSDAFLLDDGIFEVFYGDV